jgi:hypothetical protein
MDKKGVNGCGCGSGLLKYFKPPYAQLFKIECNAHDLAYDEGGFDADRRHADRWLYKRMVGRITDCELSPYKTTWLMCIALLYYMSVRLCGSKYFNYKKCV